MDATGQVEGSEPMQVDDPANHLEEPSEVPEVFVVENPNFDLEAYASNYVGISRIQRLLFVAAHCPSLELEALKMALAAVERTHNTTLYSSIRRQLYHCTRERSLGPESLEAVEFVQTTNKKAGIRLERLDADLKSYRSNSLKESIRRGYNEIGDHYVDTGDLRSALKMFARARDYCTSSKHLVEMCRNVIKVNIHLSNWHQVYSYFAKAESAMDREKPEEKMAVMTRFNCAAGLTQMMLGEYKLAAHHFIQAKLEHCDIPDLMSSSNVAVYGSLCALASFDRQDLHQKIILNTAFKQFLELEPQIRELVQQFHNSKYAWCLKILDEMKNTLLLDMYLASHLDKLYEKIRSSAMIQYFKPYLSADLRRMSEAFNTTVDELEVELKKLILDGRMSARIDSHAKVVFVRKEDERSAVFRKAMELGEDYQWRVKGLLLRAAMQKHKMVVTHPSTSGDVDQSTPASTVQGNR
jgi:COP9 signalosome complex subunit 1